MKKRIAIMVFCAGLAGCTAQQNADVIGAMLGASMGGPMGALAGVASVQPDPYDDGDRLQQQIDNDELVRALQERQDGDDVSGGWQTIQDGNNAIVVPDSMRGMYQE